MAFLPNNDTYTTNLSTQLELFFSCRNLPKLDVNSPSDPFVVIYQKDEKKNTFQRWNNTEVVKDNQNPDFTKEMVVDYRFEEVQIIRIEVWDADNSNLNDLTKHDYVGSAEFVLGDLVASKGQKLAMKLKGKDGTPVEVKKTPAAVTVRCEEIKANSSELILTLGAKDLPKMDFFGKVDPFIQLYRKAEDGGWMSIHKTEALKNTYTPTWKEMRLSIRRLCNGDYKRPILIKCFDWNSSKEPEYIGECETSVEGLLKSKSIVFQKRDSKTGAYKKGKTYGELLVKQIELKERFAFIDYIVGGMEINLIVAIDFTGSNGDPKDKRSLHYMGAPAYESQYLKVIRSVGRVLEPYDTDRMIGVYGFGANLNPSGKEVSHCFPLTFEQDNPQVYGIEGVIQAYVNTLNRVQLYGPTYFAEIIQTVHALAADVDSYKSGQQRYTILLMITDGAINDMVQTADAIVDASTSPLSIVIVGVGSADFSKMEELDGDETPLKHSNGKKVSRDIVQFVPFQKFVDGPIGALAKETLAEIPAQVEKYMEVNKVSPNKRRMERTDTMVGMYEGPSKLANGETLYPPLQQTQLQSQPYQSQYTQPMQSMQQQQPFMYQQMQNTGQQNMVYGMPNIQQYGQQQNMMYGSVNPSSMYGTSSTNTSTTNQTINSQTSLSQTFDHLTQTSNPYYSASAPPP